MELRHLRYFLAVAGEGNMTRAARILHVAQPTLSRQLADLERELGCVLFDRESRGVVLTDDGRLLQERAQEIVQLADRAERELRADRASVEGDVWVGGGECDAMRVVARAATQVAASYPDVRLRLHSGNADDVIDRVDRGLLDFGVVIGRTPDARFDALTLPGSERWGVLMRADDPLASRELLREGDLAGRRTIVSDQTSDRREEDDVTATMLASLGGEPVATYTLLYNASLLVERGMGVAICLGGIVAAGEGTPFAFVPTAVQPPVPAYIIWRRLRPFSRASMVFLEALRENLYPGQAVERGDLG